jgi:diguanylate cyclase (GGDEF)-like protein
MCDLDHFKACNDRFGHGAGDLMLIRFAEVMRESTENAILARYGGEEFAVLLPDASKADALAAAERIRLRVEQAEFMLRREKIQMTVSIGVAVMPEDTLDLEALVEKADQALYKAKGAGRNRVCSNDQ